VVLGGNVLEVLAALGERLTKEVAQSSPLDLLVKVIAALMLTAFVYAGQKLVRRGGSWLSTAFPSLVGLPQKDCPRTSRGGCMRPWIVANDQAQSASAEHYPNPAEPKQTRSHDC
jgi:hypothetical protein